MTVEELRRELDKLNPKDELYYVAGRSTVQKLDVYFEYESVWVDNYSQETLPIMRGDY